MLSHQHMYTHADILSKHSLFSLSFYNIRTYLDDGLWFMDYLI